MERFAKVDCVQNFIDKQKNRNTNNKTGQDVNLVMDYFKTKGETRVIQDIPPSELNAYLSEFFLSPCGTKIIMNMNRQHLDQYWQVSNDI